MREEWKDKLQNALADFEESAPEGLWDNIDKALAAQNVSVKGEDDSRHRRVVVIRGVLAAACVACGVGLFLSLPDGEDGTGDRQLAEIGTRSVTSAADKRTHNDETEKRGANDIFLENKKTYTGKAGIKEEKLLSYMNKAESLNNTSVCLKDEASADTKSLPKEVSTEEASVMASEKENSTPAVVNSEYRQNRAKVFSSDNHLAYNRSKEAPKRETDGGFAASLYAMNSMGVERGGAGGVMVASSAKDFQFGSLYDNDNDATFKFLAAKSTLQKEKAKHHIPLRAGLSVRYALNNRFGIETGLTYTFLSSDFTLGEGGNRREREQRLHYVGIPLNVDYSLWRNRLFDVYVSAGGMVEKNVSGNVSTTEYVNGSVMSSEDEDAKTSKLQWSVAAAAGAQLNIVDGVGIYVEPGVGYYFKNGSALKTAYSERPLNFNLKLGLRYTFK